MGFFYKNVTSSRREQKRRAKRAEQNISPIEEFNCSVTRASLHHKENEELNNILQLHNLRIYSIAPDGHCLFRAIEHQLKCDSSFYDWNFKDLRLKTTEYLINNKKILKSFFVPESTDVPSKDSSVEDAYDNHCQGIQTTRWGGELELRALSNILQAPIVVFCAKPPHILTYVCECFTE